jgi:hypothetical protein
MHGLSGDKLCTFLSALSEIIDVGSSIVAHSRSQRPPRFLTLYFIMILAPNIVKKIRSNTLPDIACFENYLR